MASDDSRQPQATVTHTLKQLIDGTAEVFGTELAKMQKVTISNQKLAVFTWTDAKITVEGQPDVVYIAEETPMTSYVNLHNALNNRRLEAQQGAGRGPRCVVVGPTDSGKSTLCRMLINWAVRMGWTPTLVDLDIGQGSITVPGCLAATPVEVPVDIEEGYPIEAPLVFYFGHATPKDNPELYKHLVERLASILNQRADADPAAAAAGDIVNTMGWVEGLGYELLLHAIDALKADVVVVMEQDRLYSQLSAGLRSRQPAVSVVKLYKSGGVVTRAPDLRKAARTQRVREYFYGPDGKLQPQTYSMPFTDLHIFRIGGGPRAPSGALPIGASSAADPLRLAAVTPSAELLHSLLAVSHAANAEQILSRNVAGFILVTNVDTARGFITYLAPNPLPFPGRYLLMGSIQAYMDSL